MHVMHSCNEQAYQRYEDSKFYELYSRRYLEVVKAFERFPAGTGEH